MPRWIRRLGWTVLFVALAERARRGIVRLDEPLPTDQPAEWPPLAFEPASGPATTD